MKKDIKWGRCSNYHWFDVSKYNTCPQCGKAAVNREEKQNISTKKQKENSGKNIPYAEFTDKTNSRKNDIAKSTYDNADGKTLPMGFSGSNFEIEDVLSDDKTESMFDFD